MKWKGVEIWDLSTIHIMVGTLVVLILEETQDQAVETEEAQFIQNVRVAMELVVVVAVTAEAISSTPIVDMMILAQAVVEKGVVQYATEGGNCSMRKVIGTDSVLISK